MSTAYKSLILVLAATLTALALLRLHAPPTDPAREVERSLRAASPSPAVALATDRPGADAGGKFFFDVVGHSVEEFEALLHRAQMIYEQTPAAERDALAVVLVLHGPDLEYFAAANYQRYQTIVDVAARLDALGVFDFKVCARSAQRLGLDAASLPPFVEVVPYGPEELRRLERNGYVRL